MSLQVQPGSDFQQMLNGTSLDNRPPTKVYNGRFSKLNSYRSTNHTQSAMAEPIDIVDLSQEPHTVVEGRAWYVAQSIYTQ
jgi:hypothetical protein